MKPLQREAHAGQGRRLYRAAIVAILLGLTALYHAVLRHEGGMSFLKHFSIVQEGDTLVIAAPGGSET